MKLISLFQLVQDYNGAIMVMITAIYVLTTIIICIYNYRSANAAHKQVSMSNGIGLYEKRLSVIAKLLNYSYSELDDSEVKILFGDKVYNKYMDIKEVLTYAYKNKIKIDKWIDYIKSNGNNTDFIINKLDNMRKNYEKDGSSELEYIELSDHFSIGQELNYCKLYRNKYFYDNHINEFIALLEDFISKSISIE
ncbi:hypothetical protein G9F72_018210 [Clostridium estertheticum]|uniref:hypothetical protein n=1 Tax=Clostridium estertheticum TaxID=238834 RepID=UPI0013E90CCF|nr:hypothetical protein [Clostridium estertheticum]MBZ9688269.1 hypothetical protein [Clostridium estertheticum]